VAEVEHPTIGPLRVLGRPFTLGGQRSGWLQRPPPLLGEQSVEICREIGLGDAEVEELVRSGIVRDGRAAVPASPSDR
jgi:succinate--hydroxymethylglutarate CoA-transferase